MDIEKQRMSQKERSKEKPLFCKKQRKEKEKKNSFRQHLSHKLNLVTTYRIKKINIKLLKKVNKCKNHTVVWGFELRAFYF